MQLPTQQEPRIPLQPHPKLTSHGNHLIFDFDTWTYDIAFAAQDKEGNVLPFSFCEDCIETRLQEILERLAGVSYSGYLTGSGNFRHQVATVKPYKGNRKAEKPVHYEAIRQYLIDNHNAVVVNGMEADDAVAIEATRNPTAIIVSRDKDLLQLSNLVYSYPLGKSPEKFGVGELYNYLQQTITGDTTDNYPGLPGKGPAYFANTIVKEAYRLRNAADMPTFLEDIFKRILYAYVEYYGEQGIERYLEQARLAWLVRELDDQGNPVLPTENFEFYWRYYESNYINP